MVKSSHAAKLTIDRLFDAPALAGPAILGLQLSPDGSRVAYLRESSGQKDRLDLWEYDILGGRHRLLVDSKLASRGEECLSEEETARRERQRTAALSGILEYSFAPSGGSLLFSIAGKLFHLALETGPTQAVEIASGAPVTDASMSPAGSLVAYVRNQNLHVYDLFSGRETALTSDGGGTTKNGVAEFIAQEEMDRSQGYWWSPDGSHIAFAQIDEQPVAVTTRFEIAADNITTHPQRYPAAGQANVLVRVGVVSAHDGKIIWADLGSDPDFYLARVNWLPDGKTLALQRQARDQRRLDLLFVDVTTGNSRIVLSETSDTWTDLHSELTFLKQSDEFIWLSSRDGFQHLYLYDYTGHCIRRITSGAWIVDDFRSRAVKGVDETHRLVYFTATERTPTERHLYSTSLDTENPEQVFLISKEEGLHAISMPGHAPYYLDVFNNTDQPPLVSLRRIDGTLITHLLENRLDANHPVAPYLPGNSTGEIGTLEAEDGQTLYYRLYRPADFDDTKRYPAIVEVYGGPGVQRVLNNWSGSSFTQILTRAGYVVFQLDNRGTASRGIRFQAQIHRTLGQVEVADQIQGTKWLASQTYVDASRIGVWGWSYGGYMTLMLMLKAPGVFRAGVSGAPVTDWTLYDTHYTERYLSRPEDNASGYRASSVLSHASGLNGALLVMHGMADDNVLFLHSTKLFRALQELGKPFQVMVYPGAKHALLRQHDGRHAYAAILSFFETNLLK